MLRFFKEKSLNEVAEAMKVTEAAAQSRVHRAMEKLRKHFMKRGVTLATGSIAGAIAANSVQAAPVGLAKATTAVAVAKGAAASASTLTLIKGALKVMAWTKLKTTAVVGIAALLAVGATTLAVEAIKKPTDESIEKYFTMLSSRTFDTAPPMVLLRPSKYAGQGSWNVPARDMRNGNQLRRGAPFAEILHSAYGFGPEQMVLPSGLPRGQFDLLLTVPTNAVEELRKEIKKQFGVVAHPEKRVTDVLILKNTNPNAPGLKISTRVDPASSWPQPGFFQCFGFKMSDPIKPDLVHEIGQQANLPVIDETGLTNAYDIDFHWNANLQGDAMKADIMRELNKQLGLVLIPERREVEMLVVEKVK